ncbi:MAG: ATP-binding protein [Pseudomonadota bacterium]
MDSIFTRTYIALVILVFIGFMVSAILVGNLLEEEDSKLFQRDAGIEANLFEEQLHAYPDNQWANFADTYTPIFETTISIISLAEVEASEFRNLVSLVEETAYTPNFEGWWLLRPLTDGQYFLLIEENDVPPSMEEFLTILVPLTIVAMIIGLAFLFISRNIAHPLQNLSTAALALGEGRMKTRVDVAAREPFKSLAMRFNQMADAIEVSTREQEIMIGALPHELRTPLSRLRFALDMTRAHKSLSTLQDQLESIDGYLDDLEAVVDNTLLLSRLRLDDAPDLATFDLHSLIAELCDERADVTSKALSYQRNVQGNIKGSEALITLVLNNLIDNALRHCATTAYINAERQKNGYISICVEDDGSGIPKEQQASVFMPFMRLDDSRTRQTGGIGLGLAIVELIARRLGGSVTLAASQYGGARFIFCWPQSVSK